MISAVHWGQRCPLDVSTEWDLLMIDSRVCSSTSRRLSTIISTSSWTEDSYREEAEGSRETLSQQQRCTQAAEQKLLSVCATTIFQKEMWCSDCSDCNHVRHTCLKHRTYHRASLNYGKDAAKDPRTDEQLPLLAQMQVDVMQNYRQQNTTRLWEQRERRRKDETKTLFIHIRLTCILVLVSSATLYKPSHLSHQGRRRGGSQLYGQWTAVWLHP